MWVSHSVASDSETQWTVAHQALLSMGFSRREYWIVWPFPSPGDLPSPGIEPGSYALQADSLPSEPPRKAWESACSTRDLGSIPGSGRSPGEGNGYALQYSCRQNFLFLYFTFKLPGHFLHSFFSIKLLTIFIHWLRTLFILGSLTFHVWINLQKSPTVLSIILWISLCFFSLLHSLMQLTD